MSRAIIASLAACLLAQACASADPAPEPTSPTRSERCAWTYEHISAIVLAELERVAGDESDAVRAEARARTEQTLRSRRATWFDLCATRVSDPHLDCLDAASSYEGLNACTQRFPGERGDGDAPEPPPLEVRFGDLLVDRCVLGREAAEDDLLDVIVQHAPAEPVLAPGCSR